jgi:ATP-dependent RNA helicase DDX5/DBP2
MTGEDKVLIFCGTKKGSEDLAFFLNNEGFRSLALHGDKSQKERDRAMDNFKKSQSRIMVATDVVSRGLDIKDISYVINFDFPKCMDDYVQFFLNLIF